jgi:hypothetical protein
MSARETQVGGSHYSSMAVQPWDALDAWMTPEELRGYHKGIVIAYLAREKQKGGDQDIRKAAHHLQKLVELLDAEQAKQPEPSEHQKHVDWMNSHTAMRPAWIAGLNVYNDPKSASARVSQHEINESKKRD